MKTTITEYQAHELFDKYLKSENMRRHSLQSKIIMKKLAQKYKQDEEYWGITGLLHDLDMDVINGDMSMHGTRTIEILKEEGYDIPDMFEAILAHTEGLENSPGKRTSQFHYILAGAETITGILMAYVLMRPEKKIEGTKVKSIVKKLKDKSFAASVNRQFIYDVAENTDMERSEFIQLSIDALTEAADEIGM